MEMGEISNLPDRGSFRYDFSMERRQEYPSAWTGVRYWKTALAFCAIAMSCVLMASTGGMVDPAFHNGFELHSTVSKIVVQKDGKIVATTDELTYDGRDIPSIVRFLPNGELDPSFRYKDLEFSGGGYFDFRLDREGRVLAMGSFYTAEYNEVVRLVRLKTDGSLDRAFATQTATDDRLITFLAMKDGSIVVAGEFARFMSGSRNSLARIRPDGTFDTAFNPGRNYPQGSVDTLLELANGDILAGYFHWTPRSDPNQGLVRIRADGSQNPVLPYFPESLASPLLLWNGKVLLDQGSAAPLRSIRDDGYLTPCFAIGIQPYPKAFLCLSDGRILVYYRPKTDHGKLVRLFADGSVDSSFNLDVYDGDLQCIQETPDGKYLISGFFQTVNEVFSPGLARVFSGNEGLTSSIRFNGAKFGALSDEAIIQIPVLRTGDATQSAEVAFATTLSGSDLAGTQYLPTNGVIHFDPGQRLAAFNIGLIPGPVDVAGATVGLELSGALVDPLGAKAAICLASTIGTIEFATNAYTIKESQGSSYVGLVRSGGPMGEAQVSAKLLLETARSNDFVGGISGGIFYAGSSIARADFSTLDNNVVEENRTFSLELDSLPTGYRAGITKSTRVTILDDDRPGHPGEALNLGATEMWGTPDGGVLLSGDFTNIFGQIRPGVAKLDADGRLSPLFADLPFSVTRILDAHPDGRFLIETATNVFIRGSSLGQLPRTELQLRKPDGSILSTYRGTNKTLGVGLLEGGGYIRATARTTVSQGVALDFYTLSELTDLGDVRTNYLTAFRSLFSLNFNSTPAVQFCFSPDGSGYILGFVYRELPNFFHAESVLRFDRNKAVDTQFSTEISGSDWFYWSTPGSIRCWPLPGGTVLVAGQFRAYNNSQGAGILRLTKTGSEDATFAVFGQGAVAARSSSGNAVYRLKDGRLLAVWYHDRVAQLVRLGPDGDLDKSFSKEPVANDQIDCLTVVADGRIVVSGRFTQLAGQPRTRLAWLTPEGELLPDQPLAVERENFIGDGLIELGLHSRRSSMIVIESSVDFKEWSPISRQNIPLGRSRTLISTDSSDLRFFRVRMLP